MKNANDKNTREAKFELLRIVSMIMVVLMHFSYHGGILNDCKFGSMEYAIFWGIRAFVYPCVNLFVLLSAYFMVESEIKISRVFRLYCQVIFYSLLGYMIFVFISGDKDLKVLLNTVFPLASGTYWFATDYALMYVLSPLINIVINNLNKDKYKITLLVLVVVFCVIPTLLYWSKDNLSGGRDLPWFITLYFIGGYIRKYGVGIDKKISILIYIASSIALLLTNYLITLVFNSSKNADVFYGNNTPLVILSSIALFLLFLNIDIKNANTIKIICKISSYSFGVYLFHENPLCKKYLWDFVSPMKYWEGDHRVLFTLAWMIAVVLIIYTLGSLIEALRKRLYSAFSMSIVESKIDKIASKYRS